MSILPYRRAVLFSCLLWPAMASAGDGDWTVELPSFGAAEGSAPVTVVFRATVENAPLTFGIPVGQAISPDRVKLADADGNRIPADVEALGNWSSQPARWALISCVVSGKAGELKPLRVEWGDEAVKSPESPLVVRTEDNALDVENSGYSLRVDATGMRELFIDGETTPVKGWSPSVLLKDKEELRPETAALRILRKGPSSVAARFESALSESVDLHQEYYFYAGSPFVRVDVRFVNHTVNDVPVNTVVPVSASFDAAKVVTVGLVNPVMTESCLVRQHPDRWQAGLTMKDGPRSMEGYADDLGEWSAYWFGQSGFMAVFPEFQELAAGDFGVSSIWHTDPRTFSIAHYTSESSSADVRFREGMARTFTYWLVMNPPAGEEDRLARAVKAPPYVVYDRAYLTRMGVFLEERVSHLYDTEVHEAALYFKRAQVPRIEYPRCSRGADPGRDKSGEGFYEVDLHAGGMVYGEVFQYFEPKPNDALLKRYNEEIGVSLRNIVTGGECTYRNGDIVLALFQQYLRSGDPVLHDFARVHARVYADVGISHADISNGLGHYYCDWYGNPYVYQRFEGLLLAYLVTGDPWWFETAEAMAEYCVRAWKEGEPADGHLNGTYGGIQHRSPYIAKMLLKLYGITGDEKYADTAVRLARWIIPKQEPEGWWVQTSGSTREFRNSPIFAGYTAMGLWPLYWTTRNDELRACLMKTVDYHLGMQEDVTGHNPGTIPNSYWYGDTIKNDTPIEGNYATTSHWAHIMLNAYWLTGDPKYFYSANAAWVGVLNHQTEQGGVPLSNSVKNSVWSHVMVEALPAFAATAEARGLPFVMDSRTGVPGTSFMAKGAAFEDGAFTFDLKYASTTPLTVRVFWPGDAPETVMVDSEAVPSDYSTDTHIALLTLPPKETVDGARVVLN